MPVLHLIAGPNGAGKSTLYRYLIEPRYPDLPFINADLYEQAKLQHVGNPQQRSEAARAWADAEREAQLKAGRSFVSETVFSHPSKLELVRRAQAAGFEVAPYVVCLDEPRCLLVRVKQRVREGGHNVPGNKILERYPRTVANLREAVQIVNLAMLFDATDTDEGGPVLLASVVAGEVQLHAMPIAKWAGKVLGLAKL